MSYSDFKTWLTTFLWKTNDTVLVNNLDKLIKMAEAELNRTLAIQRRQVTLTIEPEAEDYDLPDDFQHIVSLSNLQPTRQARSANMKLSTLHHIYDMRARTDSSYIEPYYCTVRRSDGNTLYLVGPFSAENPGKFELEYRASVPDFATDDTSWLYDDYLDLYTYTALSHSSLFLREDERLETWRGMKNEALLAALDEDKRYGQFGGSPMTMQPHRAVPVTKRRR